MGESTRLWAHDTFVNAARPDQRYYSAHRLGLRKWDSPNAQYAYITFTRPSFTLGAKITRATLTFQTYAIDAWGDHTMNVTRVNEKTAYSRMTWNNRPGVDEAGQVSVTKNGKLPGGQEWDVDVTAMMQRISNGSSWYGFRITTGDDAQRWVYADENLSESVIGPRLVVEWADEPDEPQSLSPNEGVVGTPKPALEFEYIDISGDVDLQAVQIQTSDTTSFANPTWDSGEHPATRIPVYLSGTTYPGAQAGKRVYYRMKVKDGGLWSEWSAVAWFVYRGHPEGVMTSFQPDNPRFGDSTPDLSWDFANQSAYHITIARTANPGRILWNSGKITSAENVVSVPPGVLKWDDTNYRVIVRLWDKESRVRAANALPYQVLKHDVHLDEDLGLTPVTIFKAEQVGTMPYIDLEWDRSVSADAFDIVRQDRDGEKIIIAQVTYADTYDEATGRHVYRDKTAPGHTPMRYIIRPVVDGQRGGGTPTPSMYMHIDGIWLFTPYMTLFIAGDENGTHEMPELETVHQVLNAAEATIVRSPFKGRSGTVEGTLIHDRSVQPSRDAQNKKEVFLKMKADPRDMRLAWGDSNIPIKPSAMNVQATPHAPTKHPTTGERGLRYSVSFNYNQSGDWWWDRL